MSDLRLVDALSLSIPSTQLLAKFGDKLQTAPAIRPRPAENPAGGIPVEPRDGQKLVGNTSADGGTRQRRNCGNATETM